MIKEKVLNEAQNSFSVFNHKFIVAIKINQVLQKCSAGDWALQNQHAMKWLDGKQKIDGWNGGNIYK